MFLDLGPRDLAKSTRMKKELDRYLGVTYINICHITIMTKTLATFLDLEIPIIVMYTGTKRTKTDTYMT